MITAKVYDGIYSGKANFPTPIISNNLFIGVKTSDLDNLAAETCAYMSVIHPDYSKLAARIAISHLHKTT